jgi:Tfp pilus assembly protein PilF
VTQLALANLLAEIGRNAEAEPYYTAAMETANSTGDRRGLAVIQHAYASFLYRQGRPEHATRLVWQAYSELEDMGFAEDARNVAAILIEAKERHLGPERFDVIWDGEIDVPQPEWLSSGLDHA